jgi:hypothetical protein
MAKKDTPKEIDPPKKPAKPSAEEMDCKVPTTSGMPPTWGGVFSLCKTSDGRIKVYGISVKAVFIEGHNTSVFVDAFNAKKAAGTTTPVPAQEAVYNAANGTFDYGDSPELIVDDPCANLVPEICVVVHYVFTPPGIGGVTQTLCEVISRTGFCPVNINCIPVV